MWRTKIISSIMIILAHATISQSTYNAETEKQIKEDINERFSNVNLIGIKYREWGVYMATLKSDTKFGTSTLISSEYVSNGDWLQDKYIVYQEAYTPKLQEVVNKEAKGVKTVVYFETSFSKPYYQLILNSERRVFYTKDFSLLVHGGLRDGLKLTKKISKDMEERLISPQVLRGWKKEEVQTFEILAETPNGHNNVGQIEYDEKGNWLRTKYYMNDYFKLPLELLMYVNDNGGLEQFEKIVQHVTPKSLIYMATINKQTIKLDEDLKELE